MKRHRYPARSRKFSVGKKYHPQSYYLASKHYSKRDAKGKAGLLRNQGWGARVVFNKTDKVYVVYGNSHFGRKKKR